MLIVNDRNEALIQGTKQRNLENMLTDTSQT